MRRVAVLPSPVGDTHRVMLFESREGVFLFLCGSVEDRGAFADEWYETLAHAEAECAARFGVPRGAWTQVPDAPPGCQQDYVTPVRVRELRDGRPDWGHLERLEDGRWVPVEHHGFTD